MRASCFGLTLSVLLCASLAWGQEASLSDSPTPPRPAPQPATATREGNVLRVNGKPTVLLWAQGLEDAKELASYAAAGFNTLAVPITSVSEKPLATAFDLASAGEEQGLLVLGVLAPQKLVDAEGEEVACDPLLDAYPEAVQAFVQQAVAGFGRHPRLIAWVIALDPETVVWGDAGFQQFLQGAYRGIDDLNASWGSNFAEFEAISCDAVRALDASRPGGVGRASVDYADYRQKTYADAVAVWTAALAKADPPRLELVGGLTDYRSAIGLEKNLDGLVMETTSRHAESDYATANVHAVDLARRANTLLAMQTLDVSTAPAPTQLRNWINLALLHGASGVQLAPWSDLADAEELRDTVKQAAAQFAAGGRFPLTPTPRTAVLYEPYAGGEMRGRKSLYGYLDGLTEQEPSTVFYTVRNGSRYGLVDVLSLDTLSEADLSQYGALLVPMAFYLPDKAQAALHQFALQGGVLLADAGVGMYQAQGTVGSLTDILRETFGVQDVLEEKEEESPVKTMEVPADPTAPLPSVGGATRPRTQQEELLALLHEVQEMLGEPNVSEKLGLDYNDENTPGMRSRELGKGVAIYAPLFLYDQWDAESDSYAQFHDRLLGWQPDLRIGEPDGLWPPVEATCSKDGAVTLVTAGGVATALRCYGMGNQLFQVPQGAVRVWDPSADEPVELLFPGDPLATATPVPIIVTPQEEGTSATVALRRYDATGLVLALHGTEAVASPSEEGVVIRGGSPTPLEISIGNGAFPITPGQSYRIVVEENGRSVADYTAMPDRESRSLLVQGSFRSGQLTITPAAAGS